MNTEMVDKEWLDERTRHFVKSRLCAQNVDCDTVMQELWASQGYLLRLTTDVNAYPTVVLKVIKPTVEAEHRRGWNTQASYQRKIFSYGVEANWYRQYAQQCNKAAKVPECLGLDVQGSQRLILMEDLRPQFPVIASQLNLEQVELCLCWLADFHACFLGHDGEGLWPEGCYWHLGTRQDEYQAMTDGPVKEHAGLLDEYLRSARYQTLVHGDAKLANFCFSADMRAVSAVDFQYVGRGCGIRDVAYLLGSCLSESDCMDRDEQLLDHYFTHLRTALGPQLSEQAHAELEREWRGLYAVAWTDFYRFLLGWMPGHAKINAYTRQLAEKVLTRPGLIRRTKPLG